MCSGVWGGRLLEHEEIFLKICKIIISNEYFWNLGLRDKDILEVRTFSKHF